MSSLLKAELPGVPLASRGKVRDIFHVGGDLLIVSSDRLSAFDVVLEDPIPDKGKVLNLMSDFWFRRFADTAPHHMITTAVDEFPETLHRFRDVLEGRAMLVRRAEPLPVECIVRGYLVGSGWKQYQADRTVSGVKLPEGLRQADKLPEPVFTPTTKAQSGHDEPIPMSRVEELVGGSVARMVEDISLRLYIEGARYALEKGIVIADTKFEFGLIDGSLVLIDEVLTPDSSRFWDVDDHEPGTSPPSFDKQYVRDYLEGLDWDKTPPAPRLPAEVIEGTANRYREAFRRITGSEPA